MGKIVPDRVRPIKLFLYSADEVNKLIAHKNVFEQNNLKLMKDSTIMERQYLLNLRTELNERIANGEQNITIKYQGGLPTIVQRNALNGNMPTINFFLYIIKIHTESELNLEN